MLFYLKNIKKEEAISSTLKRLAKQIMAKIIVIQAKSADSRRDEMHNFA